MIRVRGRAGADRDGLHAFLTERGIAAELVHVAPLHLQPCLATLAQGSGSLPVSERAAREILALPMHGALRDDEIERVVETIASYFEA